MTFFCEGRTYTDVLPVDSEVRFGTTYGFFEVEGNKEWIKPETEWGYSNYDQVSYTFRATGDFLTDDWASEAQRIPISFRHSGVVYHFTVPSRTYVSNRKVYGVFNVSVAPLPITGWRIYSSHTLAYSLRIQRHTTE